MDAQASRARPVSRPTSSVARFVPILGWLPRYDRHLLKRDLAAGVAVTRVPAWDDRAFSAVGVIIDAEGFRSNAYLMPYLSQLSPHVRRNLERGARLTPADRLAAERTRTAVLVGPKVFV